MLTKEQLEQIQYTNLVTKSHYSIPFGVGKIKDQISSAAKKGHRGIAIVDDFAMNGILEAYSLSKDKDFLKKLQKEKFPILLGTKINVTDSLDTQDSSLFNISIYAQNWQGYKNMTHLTSLSSMPGNGYINGDDKLVKRISLENLAERADGLLVGSGNIDGILSQSIMKGTGQEEDLIQIFKEIFGDNFFIELHFHPKTQFWNNTAKAYQPQNQDVQKVINLELIRLAKQYDIKCCLVQDSYMFDKKFDYIQNILIANHKDYKSSGFYFDTPKYMMSVTEMYEYIQKNSNYITDDQFIEFCENSNFFVDKCKDIELEFEPALPKIEYMDHPVFSKEEKDKYETLFNEKWKAVNLVSPAMGEIFKIAKIRKDIALETSLKSIIRLEKMPWDNKEYLDRLALELKVLARNGVLSLLDYFLLLEDVTNFIRKHGYLRGFGRGCLHGDALVLTSDKGYVKIKDINVGDFVYSHLGKKRKVLKTFKYKTKKNEKLLTIKTERSLSPISLTKDHKVYGIKRSLAKGFNPKADINKRKKYNDIDLKDLTFAPAETFNVGDLLYIKKPSARIVKDLDVIDLSLVPSLKKASTKFVVNNDSIDLMNGSKQMNRFSRYIPVDEEFSYMLGKWIGDGWYVFNEKSQKYLIGYAFNSKDIKEIKRTKKYFENMGFSVSLQHSKKTKLVQLYVYNKLLAETFKNLFPDYKSTSLTKYIGKFKYLPDHKLLSLLLGLKSADGSEQDVKGGDRRENIDTSSRQLMLDVKESLTYLNISATVKVRTSYFDERFQSTTAASYKIDFIGLGLEKRERLYQSHKDGCFVKIREINEIKAPQYVYDINVELDNSFLTSEYIVHNSGGGSLLTYVMDVSDIEPIKYKLLFERFFTQDKIGVQTHEKENYSLKEYSTEKPKDIDAVVKLLTEIESMFDAKRLKEVNPEFLAKELYYIECNDELLSYYKNLAIKCKTDKISLDNNNNSTLAYLLGITDQVPKKTIKQSEPSMPDFDYDTDGRDLVKKYLTEKNGVKHVTLIGTLGSLKTKGAIKDVIRQLRPDMDVTRDVNPLTEKFNVIKTTDEDKIRDTLQMAMTTKNVDYSSIDFKSELAYFYACLEADSKLHEWFENNKEVKDAVVLLLGNAKGTGVHAGGIVVSRKEIMELCPLTWDHDEGLWVTQYEMAYVEKAGLIKYDFLGLKTLEDFNRCLKLVNSRHGTNYNLSNIPMEDKAIFELFVQGKTESVFQFNGNLPIAILTQLKEVRGIDDLAMITSIARPGPLKMGMDKVFIKRNTGEEPVEYLHPSLKPILENTYGILCIAKGQKVKTQTDREVNIENVKIGSYVLTEDGTYHKVLNNIYKGKKETIVIKFQKGQSLECTKDHKVLTNLGWVEAQFLIKNNEHLAVKHFDANNKPTFDIVSSLTIKNELTDVYDLSIDKVHSFVVGGHVVHNCYQEHVLMIAQDIGELPPSDSVKFMKALSKKKPETVEKLVQKIKKVAIDKHHFKEEVTKELMELIQAFSLYAFNKSHAAAYACVSYICMWLKHYYPAEWISAVLSGAKKEDLEILYPKWKDYIVPPSINQSKDTFQINEHNKVVMPFGAVNGVGDKAVAEIIKMQPYTSFEDFMNRVNRTVVNKGPTLAMIFAGIFDEFKPEEETKQRWRKLLVRDYFKIKFALSKPSKKDKEEAEAYFKEIVAMNRGQILMKEISILNFTAFDYYEYYKDKMTDGAMAKFGKQAIRPADVSMYPTDSWVVVGGMIESIEFKRTKKGDEMAIIKLSNNGTSISIQVFPKQLEQDDASDSKLIRNLEKYSPIMIKGKVNRWEGRLSLVFDTAHLLL